MRSRWLNVLAAFALPAAAASQGMVSDARPIGLDEAIKLAQQNAPAAISARNSLRTGQSQIRQSAFSYLPTLSLSTNATQRGGEQFVNGIPVLTRGDTLHWSYSRTLSIGNIQLWDGNRRWNNYRSAQANQGANESNEILQRYVAALSVKTQYFAVIAARESEAVAQRQLEAALQQLAVSTAKVNAGIVTRADSLSAVLAVGTARFAILNAQTAVRNANASLTRLVATPFTVTAIPDSLAIEPIAVDEAALMTMVLDGPQVRSSTASLNAAKATHRAALAPYSPTLSLGASYGPTMGSTKTFDPTRMPTGTNNTLSFTVGMTLWDNYQREAQVVSTTVAQENAEASLRDAKMFAQQQMTQQLNTYRTALEQIQLQQLQINAAEENVRVVQQQYNLGTRQLLDVLTAQNLLISARNGLVGARQSARLAKANIEQLIGRDLR